MEIRPILSSCCDEAVRQLYETAFPDDEKIPWDELLGLVETMSLDFQAYYEGESLIALTIVYPRPSFSWFWYFAVKEELRGRGWGQRILRMVTSQYKDHSLILDMEDPAQVCENTSQRQRRHAFYLRNGFRDTGVGKYYGSVAMTILLTGEGTFTMQDYEEVIQELRSFWTIPD